MNDNLNKLSNEKRKTVSDFLELGIVLAFIFLIISIYVPRAIWDEEESYEVKANFTWRICMMYRVFTNP